jgi:uncharacterized protein (DUF2235 family)
MAPKNILICIDGTWNTSKNQSNVFKFYAMTEESESQVKFYFEGLGTRWFSRVPGGLFGLGIKQQILRAYSAIIDTFLPGDEIYLVGFSRGAYAVRALSGLLYFCGVLKRDHKDKVNAAWKHYMSRGRSNTFQYAVWSDPCVVALLACFDTVGSIGIPFTRTYAQGWFPHLYPMPNVRTIKHALALDEKRALFKPVLFEERPAGFEE